MTYAELMALFRAADVAADQRNAGTITKHEYRVARHGRPRTTTVQYDHFVPLVWLGHSPARNWLAACNVCNGIKSDLLFESVHHARMFILDRWGEKGYALQWRAPCSCEKDPRRWAINFATYLAGLPRGLAQTVDAHYPSKRIEVVMRQEARTEKAMTVTAVSVGDVMIEVGRLTPV